MRFRLYLRDASESASRIMFRASLTSPGSLCADLTRDRLSAREQAKGMARFRTRARTVDMLGRQQIAGIPTAISELFKNAYDAYATHVEVDFYRPEDLLVLRDNGFGMTRDDVEERWLVLGTDNQQTGSTELAAVASSLDMQRRTPTGEKGIGRLAIAAIGPQVLLVTRAKRLGRLYPTVAAFVNWTLFTLPRISLDEIDIPVLEFPDGEVPSADELSSLVEIVRKNLGELRHRIDPIAATEIEEQLSRVDFDPIVLQRRFRSAALGGSGTGTQFYIQPTDPMLQIALDAAPERRRAGDLQKALVGFTNTMTPGRDEPLIVTDFWDHPSADASHSIIGSEEFLTPEEFDSADHHIRGEFDEYGQFVGTASIYGGKPEPHTIAWPEARGRRTQCGPFNINFAYVQGAARESRIPHEQWGRLTTKLDKMGGLYIYRNGIRILPYGNTDYDFLNIEERRNLGAGYYFFSYRRIFGAIELPFNSSRRLVEKAGREGFRENKAYRQFRAILENFFVQLAADYFREEASRGAQYRHTKEHLDRQAKALEHQARRSMVRRRELATALKDRAIKIGNDEAKEAAQATVQRLASELEGTLRISDPDNQIQAILRAEGTARRQIFDLREKFRIAQPRGVGLPRSLRRDLEAYRAEYVRLNEEIFKPALTQIDAEISSLDVEVNRRRRFDAGTKATSNAARSAVVARQRASRESLRETSERVRYAIQQATADLESTLAEVSRQVQRTDLTKLTDGEIVQFTLTLDARIDSAASEKQELLETISQQLEAITVTPDESGQIITQLDVAEATEEELFALQDRAEADLELTQLGMAIEIIDHEFQSTIRSIRNNLRRLKVWADINDQLSSVYDGIRVNFEHLDGYLTLFTPLHRRLYRTAIEIKGSEINKFLSDLFRERLARHSIEFRATRSFLSHRVVGYPSTFYPVFVNIVDNAIYWLQDQSAPRIIRLDTEGEAMIVMDNGPGVPIRDREAIFELGFTRKPGGRGLGLYISRDVLSRIGYDLTITSPTDGQGVAFWIKPKDQKGA